MSSLAQRMNTEELQAANDGLCKRVEDQAALIRELVGALDGVLSSVIEAADDCVQTHSETAERIRAARVALSRVPAEYLERDNG